MDGKIVGVRSERLPTDADFSCAYRMVRSPAHPRALKLIIHSHDMLGLRTHYWMRRTGPCFEAACEPCSRGMRSRWNGYVLGQLEDGERVIFEFTPPAGKALDEAFTRYGTMRGLKVICSRTSEQANAKVHLQCKGLWSEANTIGRVPDTWPILKHIWGLTTTTQGIVGPMAAQTVSESEMLAGTVSPVPVRKRNKIPQKSLLRSAGEAPLQADRNELLDAIARQAFADGTSIDRVNGRGHAAS